jgi:hypothetical protein
MMKGSGPLEREAFENQVRRQLKEAGRTFDVPEPEQKTIRSNVLIRPPGFEGRRAGETKDFANRRKKNRVRNKLARKARKR